MLYLKLFLLILISVHNTFCAMVYEVSDDLGVGRQYDGIGGISGGGVKIIGN